MIELLALDERIPLFEEFARRCVDDFVAKQSAERALQTPFGLVCSPMRNGDILHRTMRQQRPNI